MFVSRLDVLVDPILEAQLERPAEQARLRGLVGKVAIANAKLAYQDWKEVCAGPRWQALAASRRPRAAPPVGEHEHQGPALS